MFVMAQRLRGPVSNLKTRLWTNPPFANVTSLAAAVVAASGVLDAVTSDPGVLGSAWTWLWTGVAAVAVSIPAVLGSRFPPVCALAGCYLFIAVTAVQMAVSTQGIVAINNLIFYPMLACYLGWFFSRLTARSATGVAITASGVAVAFNPTSALVVTWLNLMLASLFCLEAASYLHRRLQRQVETDPLTGALNRIGFRRIIAKKLRDFERTTVPLALVIVDLDHFKQVNDQHGHHVGDQVLTRLVAEVRANVRSTDVVARIGGDEFVIVLPGIDEHDARVIVDRLHATTTSSWSSGMAFSQHGDTVDTLLARADLQLLVAKRASRSSG